MNDTELGFNFQKYLDLEQELSKKIAHYLWAQFPFKNKLDLQYSESYADNYWIVGLTPRGLYFEAYGWEEYSKIAKELGIPTGDHSFDPVFTQDIRFFEKLPFHVLRYFYVNIQTVR